MPNYGICENQKAWGPEVLLPGGELPGRRPGQAAGPEVYRHPPTKGKAEGIEGKSHPVKASELC